MHTIGRSDVLIVSQRVTKAKSNITVVNLNKRLTNVCALKSHMAFGVETASKFEMLKIIKAGPPRLYVLQTVVRFVSYNHFDFLSTEHDWL